MQNTLSDTSVLNIVAEAVNANLLLNLQELISRNDPTMTGLVRLGLLQDSPLKGGINVLTQFNDPDDPNSWRHSLLPAEGHKLDLTVPAYELGGGQMWFRRFTTKLIIFLSPKATRAASQEAAQVILSRAESSILTTPLTPLAPDSFGEVALQVLVSSSINIEGGGPGQFIYNGTIWWCCLTDKAVTFG